MPNKFKLDKISKSIDKAVNNSLEIMAKDAKVFFEKSFKDEGFTDNSLVKWQPRRGQLRIKGLGAAAAINHPNTKPTLTKYGVLKRSIRISQLSYSRISVYVPDSIEYAAIHNDGSRGGRVSMPKRKYLGNSRLLERRMLAKLKAQINTAIKTA